MTDTRRVEPRCTEYLASDFGRAVHRCVFREEHDGLHCSDGLSDTVVFPAAVRGPRMRWGTPEQLHEESAYAPKPLLLVRCVASVEERRCDLAQGHDGRHQNTASWSS